MSSFKRSQHKYVQKAYRVRNWREYEWIPPRKDAQLVSESVGPRERNRNIRARARLEKRKWHVESGYSKRSRVETTFHRYKAIVGPAMRARRLASQRVEARIGCKSLNTMAALGMPDGGMIG